MKKRARRKGRVKYCKKKRKSKILILENQIKNYGVFEMYKFEVLW